MRLGRIVLVVAALVAALGFSGAALAAPRAALAAPRAVPGPPSGTLDPGTHHLDFSEQNQQIILTFDGSTGDRLFLTQTGGSFNVDFDIYEPAAAGGTKFAIGNAYDYAVTLPTSGTFTIVFFTYDGAPASGDILSDLSANVDGGVLQPGQTVTNQTTHDGQEVTYHFNGKAGQRPTVFATKQSFVDQRDPSKGDLDPSYALFTSPAGQFQAADSDDNELGPYTPFAQGKVLSTTGMWTLTIRPDPWSFGSQTIRFGLVRDAPVSPLAAHRTAPLKVAEPGLELHRSFQMATGQKLALTVSRITESAARGIAASSTPGLRVEVIGPNGATMGESTFYPASPTPVQNYLFFAYLTGRYTLEVNPVGDTVGTIAARIDPYSDKSATTSIGTPTPVSAKEPLQNTTLSFTAAKGQHLSITVADASWADGSRPCTETSCHVTATLTGPDHYLAHPGYVTTDGTLDVPGNLLRSGTYQLVIDPGESAADDILGSATLTINATG